MTAEQKIDFINRWSTWFYENTSTYEGALGRQLAYLWPAIVKGNQIAVHPNSAIVRLLDALVERDCEIWQFIDIEA